MKRYIISLIILIIIGLFWAVLLGIYAFPVGVLAFAAGMKYAMLIALLIGYEKLKK